MNHKIFYQTVEVYANFVIRCFSQFNGLVTSFAHKVVVGVVYFLSKKYHRRI